VRIRPADVDDAPVVARIYVDSSNEGFRGLLPHRELDDALVARWTAALDRPPPWRWWVAAEDGDVVGFVGVSPIGELDTIAVAPAHWRAGVGSALLDVAVRTLEDDGRPEAFLWTLAGYPHAQRFYEARGWWLDGATRRGGTQVRYRRRLGRT
jgi:N-acetylglutamate synthase-like GNAT family acetyltransferase